MVELSLDVFEMQWMQHCSGNFLVGVGWSRLQSHDCSSTVAQYKLIDPTASLPSFPQITAQKFNPELHCEDGEGLRDRNHRVAPLMMLDKFVHVIDWPAGVPPIGSDFVLKDLNPCELKALVVPFLKRCMDLDYGAELVQIERKERKKNKAPVRSAVKIPDEELKFEPWSDDAKALFEHEDGEMLNIPLVTDTEGKVLRTLMDSVAFMKNLPESVVLPRAATPIVDSPAVSDLPPSSPMQWGLSPPRHEVLQPLPPRSRSHSRYRPVPVPAKVHRHQPTEAFVQHKSRPTAIPKTARPAAMPRTSRPAAMPTTSRPEPARSFTTRPDSHHCGPHRVPAMPPTCKRRRDNESEGEEARDNRRAKGSMMQYGTDDHRTQHGLQYPAGLARVYESPSPPPAQRHQYTSYDAPVRHRYSYSRTSNAVAGSSRVNTDGWKSPSPDSEVYYDNGFDREFRERRD
ncbi:hypothetical protein M405DRAFT_843131 [Rhizopogon salebrosus TDB-379]|nr:hypothetical protein M405DRAFT_843131 [Rhizopogon salebrosus TDB-379]